VKNFFTGPTNDIRAGGVNAGLTRLFPTYHLLEWHGPVEAPLHFNEIEVIGFYWLRGGISYWRVDNN